MGQPRRDWSEANELKRGDCRLFGQDCSFEPEELAHVIGREHDRRSDYKVLPDRVVALCGRHHREYDAHELDLFWSLEPDEIAQAVEDAGSPALMLKRTAPLFYRRGTNAPSGPGKREKDDAVLVRALSGEQGE